MVRVTDPRPVARVLLRSPGPSRTASARERNGALARWCSSLRPATTTRRSSSPGTGIREAYGIGRAFRTSGLPRSTTTTRLAADSWTTASRSTDRHAMGGWRSCAHRTRSRLNCPAWPAAAGARAVDDDAERRNLVTIPTLVVAERDSRDLEPGSHDAGLGYEFHTECAPGPSRRHAVQSASSCAPVALP
jgi:hypothetical protein